VKPRFFATQAKWRAWLEKNHASSDYAWLAFFKKAAGREGLDYTDAVLEALCFGWIDGQGAPMDDVSRAVRFSKRRKSSIWSMVNVGRMERLIAEGRVAPAGLREYEARTPERTGVYSHDSGRAVLTTELEARFRANQAAWQFWNTCPAGYRRQMTWWVVSAKREETRDRRMAVLIDQHARGQRIDPVHLPKVSPT
jgi:uncharacterized protein YdeI (YjbR/CyaY-like superfamily)